MSIQKTRTFLLKLAPIFAFLVYGTWAALVNYWDSSEQFIKAGLIQGSYAFTTTLLLKISVMNIYKKFYATDYAMIYTYVVSFTLLVTIPVMIHYFFDTKAIFYAILPGTIIGSVYLMLILKYEIENQYKPNKDD